MPTFYGNSKVEVADRELESTIGEDVEKLAKVPELYFVRYNKPPREPWITYQ